MTVQRRIVSLQNRHHGDTAILVANGPSLNHMDLSPLRRANVIGMNKIFLGFKRFRFYPHYYVAVNAKVIEQSVEQIKALNCVKFISERGGNLLPENGLTYHVDTQNPPARF